MLPLIVFVERWNLFSFVCCIWCAREGFERNQKKLHFFHSFFYHRGTVSQFPSRNRSSNTETHPTTSAFKKNCRNTRVDSHSHTHTLKTFIFSRLRKKKRERERERERERGTFHSRAFFSFKTQSSFLF
jgi:hypothetical protein